MGEKWTRCGEKVYAPDGRMLLLSAPYPIRPTTNWVIDELMVAANKWAANEPFVKAAKPAMLEHRDWYNNIGSKGNLFGGELDCNRGHTKLRDALALLPSPPEPAPEALTITVPPELGEEIKRLLGRVSPETVEEILVMIAKVTQLMEKGGE